MTDPEPDWVKPGTRVVRVSDGRYNRFVRYDDIERLTKTLIITSRGHRFPRKTRTIRHGGSWDGWSERLMLPGDPFVTKLLNQIRHANLVSMARIECDKFDQATPTNTAVDVILALAPLTGRADEIAALFPKETP